MEILLLVIANICTILAAYLGTILYPTCFPFNSLSIYENQMIKEKSILNIVYFGRNTFLDPRLKSVALGMIIAIILSFFGNITIGILYFTNAIEYSLLENIALIYVMFILFITGFSGMHLLAKDWIYAKREKKMSEEDIEKIKLRIMEVIPTFFEIF